MAPSAIDTPMHDAEPENNVPPPQLYPPREAHFEKFIEPQPDGYQKAKSRGGDRAAIVIDNGSSGTRAGWSFEDAPRFNITPIFSKYRDRKLGKTYSFVGNDVLADTTARGHMRNAFEAGSGIVSNWDVMESLLDYVFIKMGVEGSNGGVDVPIVMTEAVANLPYSRKSMTEIIFECYSAPSLAYGIDSLFSYDYNNGKTGLVVSSSHSSTHLIPVLNSKALLTQATRLNWGGSQSAEYLLKLIRLKYPTFPGKLNSSQTEYMIRDHCYLSKGYDKELSTCLDWTGLEDRDHVIQYPYTEEIIVQKSEEELARIAEKRKESGRRLQEQAAKMRLEKLIRKEQELDYYRDLQSKLANESKKEVKRLLDSEDLKDEAALERTIKELDKSIRKARTKDVGGPEVEEEVEEPDFSLLEIPDDQLDEAGLKQKRHQRLMKSNHEARARAKAEKEKEKARVAEERRLDEEKREKDLEGWLQERRNARADLIQKMKDRERLKADLGNRKSLASQIRMKSIANLASDNPTKKRRRGGDDDNFGANDDDWGVYRQIATGEGSDDEEEEDLGASLKTLETDLLKYDPDFTDQHTLDAQTDWTKSLVHAFLRGPRPFDPKSQAEAHQLHLNVERIRVPEVIFQPSIAGLDQAGIVEIAADILTHRLNGVARQEEFLKDIFLTGGSSMFQNFDERLRDGLRASLPAGSPLALRRAKDPILDAWKGAAKWAGGSAWKNAAITREEYLEKGSEYMKEHDLGNAYS
ncbi:actin-like ATPase domain-containing protein [Hyaloscypha bicolor E]|uniref:Actin-like ATPase domain-containing protein n=1 Tax=Hyaloscypha bicolor E TaxID=1095630 RepID=A0A2J6STU4_9HELO|nr:actin-like ATPase domain-containing protein [Hyaloscypha bicolor E]PMD54206.1 actin-like ATPase domain-containing protein [Hyaloscypha bicolor E]